MPTITLEDDATPIVRILAVTLRRAAADPGLAATMDQLQGRVALASAADAQAATIVFDKGRIDVRHGADPRAELTITANLDTMGQPGGSKPKVKGAVAHPKLALGAAKVLDPPVPGGWRGAAQRFWDWADGRRNRPTALRIVCTGNDDAGELRLGQPATNGATNDADDPEAIEVHGEAPALTALFTGADHPAQSAIAGRIRIVGAFPAFNRLIGLMTDHMLGRD